MRWPVTGGGPGGRDRRPVRASSRARPRLVHRGPPASDATVTEEDEIKAWARERIAGYKVPKVVKFRADPLPLSAAMKVLKRELRAPYWEGRDRSVE